MQGGHDDIGGQRHQRSCPRPEQGNIDPRIRIDLPEQGGIKRKLFDITMWGQPVWALTGFKICENDLITFIFSETTIRHRHWAKIKVVKKNKNHA